MGVYPGQILELEKKTYLYIGQKIIEVSLLHGGPALSFFSKAVADYFAFGQSGVSPSRDDVPDVSVQKSIKKVRVMYVSEEVEITCGQVHYQFC